MVINKIHSKWRIVEMEQWDSEYIDEEEPGYIEFDQGQNTGALHFGLLFAELDYRVHISNDAQIIEFTFAGYSEDDYLSGRGKSEVRDNIFIGNIYFHFGDESSFRCEFFDLDNT